MYLHVYIVHLILLSKLRWISVLRLGASLRLDCNLREFVFLNYRHLGPGARGKAVRNSSSLAGATLHPRRSNVTFSRICAPPRAARVWAFFAKIELPLERCRKVFALCDTSRAGAAFLARNASRSSPKRFFDLSEKIDFRSGGVVKIATLIFTRVLQTKMALQKCIISRVGDSFSKRKGNSR